MLFLVYCAPNFDCYLLFLELFSNAEFFLDYSYRFYMYSYNTCLSVTINGL